MTRFTAPHQAGDCLVIERAHLDALLGSIRELGYRIVGPTLRDGAIVYDDVRSTADLPAGWTDIQDGATYRLQRRADEALFGYAVGPNSWKKYLFPPVARVWRAHRNGDSFQVGAPEPAPEKLALLGVRACELNAMAIQDRVFTGGPYVDPVYAAQRENLLIVAVNCGTAGGTCFCVSMQTGPKADGGFDLALTEILDSDRHYFLVEIGSDLGAQAVAEVPSRPAEDEEIAAAEKVVAATAGQMGRTLQTEGLKELLYRNSEHPQWEDVAMRCLSCANCTMVCPTCFCSSIEDVSDLSGDEAERVRRWDSCFTLDFSYIHGGSVRSTPRSRYRQWMTHKLASWIDQFGTSGCVGCGRCITWCPAAIDITAEVAAIQATDEEQIHGHP
jgi:formate hydrogenlyase subunit 6/NADH:ubiquinone oxidoreductase subunit I